MTIKKNDIGMKKYRETEWVHYGDGAGVSGEIDRWRFQHDGWVGLTNVSLPCHGKDHLNVRLVDNKINTVIRYDTVFIPFVPHDYYPQNLAPDSILQVVDKPLVALLFISSFSVFLSHSKDFSASDITGSMTWFSIT